MARALEYGLYHQGPLRFGLVTYWWKVVAVRIVLWYAWFGSVAATIVILTPTYVLMDTSKAPSRYSTAADLTMFPITIF